MLNGITSFRNVKICKYRYAVLWVYAYALHAEVNGGERIFVSGQCDVCVHFCVLTAFQCLEYVYDGVNVLTVQADVQRQQGFFC